MPKWFHFTDPKDPTICKIQLKPISAMASLSTSRYLSTLTLLILYLKTSLASDPTPSFSFKTFGNGKDLSFESSVALFGDAKVTHNGSVVQLTGSVSSSAGRVMYKKPIKLLQGNPRKLASFSTYFSFSMSKEFGDGLAFFMVPSGFNGSVFDDSSFGLSLGEGKGRIRVVAVEFDTLKDVKYGDMNENHVGIDVGSLVSVRASNVSSANLVLNGGDKLQSWIDYEAASRRLEVRLSQFGDSRPVDPIVSCPIDLSKVWKEEEVFVGLSSSNGKSSQTCSVHSWSFKLRLFPQWMHSEPMDPKVYVENIKPVTMTSVQRRSNCFLKMLAAMIFGTACGALGAFLVLYLWTIFGNRRPVVPEEFAENMADYEYKKVKVVVDKTVKDDDKK